MDYRGIMEKPFFTLSIRARGGKQLEMSQDTPPGIFANGVMHSDHTLVLSTPIETIPQGELQVLLLAQKTGLQCTAGFILSFTGNCQLFFVSCPQEELIWKAG